MGGDVAVTAVFAVEGAVEAAGKVGTSTADAAREASLAAVKAADQVSTEVGKTVREALLSAASLPHDLIEKALGGSEKK